MSRVHDALRKAAHEKPESVRPSASRPVLPAVAPDQVASAVASSEANMRPVPAALPQNGLDLERIEDIIAQAPSFPFAPSPDALIVSPLKPKEAPSEEFRTLRTLLNHLQRTQSLHTLVVCSASPGEGKSKSKAA